MAGFLLSSLIPLFIIIDAVDAANYTGNCVAQWNQYYNSTMIADNLPPYTWITYTQTSSFVTTEVLYTSFSTLIKPTTRTVTGYDYAMPDGAQFPYKTETITRVDGSTRTGLTSSPTASIVTTVTSVVTGSTEVPITAAPAIPTPACSLPPIMSECQSQWDQYISSNMSATRPLCQQASIPSTQCESLISMKYDGPQFGDPSLNAWLTYVSSTWWPTTMSYAPNCTLGCRQCGITADTVKLYYWPPASATAVENGTATALISQQPAQHGSLPVTAIVDGTTLTSPTVYISYATLYASDSCSGVGRTHTNTIVPIASSAALSSLAWHNLGDFARGPAEWGPGGSWEYITKAFNYDDMNEPIPESIYNQLPSCALARYAFTHQNAFGQYTCERIGPYNPIIALPSQIKDIDPAWSTCTPWYGGAYDPPVALQPVTAIAQPTNPIAEPTIPATPGSNNAPALPQQTATSDGQSQQIQPVKPIAVTTDPFKPSPAPNPAPAPPAVLQPVNSVVQPHPQPPSGPAQAPPNPSQPPPTPNQAPPASQTTVAPSNGEVKVPYNSPPAASAKYTYAPQQASNMGALIMQPFQTAIPPISVTTDQATAYSRPPAGNTIITIVVNGQASSIPQALCSSSDGISSDGGGLMTGGVGQPTTVGGLPPAVMSGSSPAMTVGGWNATNTTTSTSTPTPTTTSVSGDGGLMTTSVPPAGSGGVQNVMESSMVLAMALGMVLVVLFL